jgi:hypothetical protein
MQEIRMTATAVTSLHAGTTHPKGVRSVEENNTQKSNSYFSQPFHEVSDASLR